MYNIYVIFMTNNFNKDDKFLLSNILDKYNKYLKTGKPTYSNFLNSYQLSIVERFLKNKKINYSIYSEYSFLEKTIIYFGDYDNFITKYKVNFSDSITHQQILGTLFSLGLKEDVIGDIIVEDGYFYYFSLTRLNNFLEDNFNMINNQVIKLEVVCEITLKKEHLLKNDILVSSMRVDTIVCRIINKSRSFVNEMISNKLIFLNYSLLKNCSVSLKENDIISIRRFGKYKIGIKRGISKKDNIILEVIKYV